MARRFLNLFCPTVAGDRLKQLVEWCDRYSPLAAADGNDGIVLDITGCTHLFGGEDKLFLDLRRHLLRMGIPSKVAIADTWGVAWALARYSKASIVHGEPAVSALVRLPVEALRLPEEIVFKLRRLGLSTIFDVRKIPHRSLDARFGPVLPWRLDQIFGKAEEPLTPWRPPAPHRASRILGEPVSTTSAVEYVLRDLMQEICVRLENSRLGSRHIEFACHRVDGSVDRCSLQTSKPTRSIPHLMRLFEDRLGTLRAGFGFEAFVLSVLDVEALYSTQLCFWQADPVKNDSSFEALIDRFGMKLGFQEVNRVHVRESLLPEYAIELCAANESSGVNAEWPAYRVRPIRLIEPPRSIGVSILIPGGSPVQLSIGQQRRRIVRSEGPERLSDEWWREREQKLQWSTRDYYRVEDDRGFRFWIFRDLLGQWFVHGQLA